jgi:hypothetical protein
LGRVCAQAGAKAKIVVINMGTSKWFIIVVSSLVENMKIAGRKFLALYNVC